MIHDESASTEPVDDAIAAARTAADDVTGAGVDPGDLPAAVLAIRFTDG